MKHIHLFEGWLKNLNPFAKKESPKEKEPKDQFIAMGMEDPMDPDGIYRDGRIDGLSLNSIRKVIPGLLDISKYYFIDSSYHEGYLAHLIFTELNWALQKLYKSRIMSKYILSSLVAPGGENAYPIEFFVDDEPILVIYSEYSSLDPICFWIAKSTLEKHFKTEESAKAYIEEIKSLANIGNDVSLFGIV
jgi:hypothetical protein